MICETNNKMKFCQQNFDICPTKILLFIMFKLPFHIAGGSSSMDSKLLVHGME
jgi:hypothetical protein